MEFADTNSDTTFRPDAPKPAAGMSWRERRRWRATVAIRPTWFQRIRSALFLVVLTIALGAALAAVVGTIIVGAAIVLERLTG